MTNTFTTCRRSSRLSVSFSLSHRKTFLVFLKNSARLGREEQLFEAVKYLATSSSSDSLMQHSAGCCLATGLSHLSPSRDLQRGWNKQSFV